MTISNAKKSFGFLFPRTIDFLFVRFKLKEKLLRRPILKFSTNIIKFDQTKEEKELYLRLTEAFREKLKSNNNKSEYFYDNIIKNSILETSNIIQKSNNPINEIFKLKDIKELLLNINLASNHKNFIKLKELYQDFKKLEISNELVYKQFIYCFIKNDIELSKKIYEDMRNNGIIPSMSCLTALIKETMGTTDADYFVKEIKDLGLQFITKNHFHVLLNYYISKNDIQGTKSLWKEMQEMLRSKIIDFKPNKFAYKNYVKFLCENDQLDDVIELLYIMKDEGIHPIQRDFVISVIQPLALNDYPQLAWNFLSPYFKTKLGLSKIHSSDLTLIIEAFIRQNDFNSVKKVLIDMKLSGINPDYKAEKILESIKDQLEEEESCEYDELIPVLKTI
ncbi:hypothetical protein RclHR1_13100003 [Rhizophagus clarus]|uniref:Putative pentatricopeptide repeat-containing protein At3g16710, mitochondrial isoform X1 n=1 Tax=Rhizophagus clarus TaxID=94130 RepID=A0A2Z6Q9A1_9GLOM|nr:hypothetical protein RclHR1_13100003 [Rhizophagus clarus]GES79066.1 putative pentatricopeptide repeat-containing protein At3g16710, mitochondrial isoform X1 [Rhizophagus clarus]